ncbi:MAG: hypothetical protein ACYDC8_05490 [Gammaproteobacteria bacterium]
MPYLKSIGPGSGGKPRIDAAKIVRVTTQTKPAGCTPRMTHDYKRHGMTIFSLEKTATLTKGSVKCWVGGG